MLEACAIPARGRVVVCAPAADAEAPAARLAGEPPPATPLVTRGVLLDVARCARRPLPPGTALTPLDLDECAERLGVTVEAGDALLLRTGGAGPDRRRAGARRDAQAGLDPACGRWLRERGVVLAASDGPTVEARLGLADPGADAFRAALLRDGLLLGTDLDLEALAALCAETREHAVLLVVPPPDALGAIRPVAIL